MRAIANSYIILSSIATYIHHRRQADDMLKCNMGAYLVAVQPWALDNSKTHILMSLLVNPNSLMIFSQILVSIDFILYMRIFLAMFA